MTFPDLESIGFGPASHRVVLRLLAFLYSDSRKVKDAGDILSRRRRGMIILAAYLHCFPYSICLTAQKN